jgi:hypothetical protein
VIRFAPPDPASAGFFIARDFVAGLTPVLDASSYRECLWRLSMAIVYGEWARLSYCQTVSFSKLIFVPHVPQIANSWNKLFLA